MGSCLQGESKGCRGSWATQEAIFQVAQASLQAKLRTARKQAPEVYRGVCGVMSRVRYAHQQDPRPAKASFDSPGIYKHRSYPGKNRSWLSSHFVFLLRVPTISRRAVTRAFPAFHDLVTLMRPFSSTIKKKSDDKSATHSDGRNHHGSLWQEGNRIEDDLRGGGDR